MALLDKNPETTDSKGDTAVCFCMAAALAGLILDEEAMEAVVQRQEAAPLFENCLSLLARTLQSLEPQAEVSCVSLWTFYHCYSSCSAVHKYPPEVKGAVSCCTSASLLLTDIVGWKTQAPGSADSHHVHQGNVSGTSHPVDSTWCDTGRQHVVISMVCSPVLSPGRKLTQGRGKLLFCWNLVSVLCMKHMEFSCA